MAENVTYFGDNDELAKWNKILANFSTIIRYFSHYWCLTNDKDKDKKTVFKEACAFDKQNIQGAKKGFTEAIKSLLEQKMYDHWVERMEGLIETWYLDNSMYYYADDADANRFLEEFLCA